MLVDLYKARAVENSSENQASS
jgi:hypothetical protein